MTRRVGRHQRRAQKALDALDLPREVVPLIAAHLLLVPGPIADAAALADNARAQGLAPPPWD